MVAPCRDPGSIRARRDLAAGAMKLCGSVPIACDGSYLRIGRHIGLNQKDRAFEWLEKAYDDRNLILGNLKTQPIYDPLRSDRRFQDLLRRMNFPL